MTTRLHSQALDVDIKHESETGIVTVKELIYKQNRYVEYSADECRIIKENIGEIDKQVHMFKKIFDGEIVDKKYNGPAVITETGIKEPDQFDLF